MSAQLGAADSTSDALRVNGRVALGSATADRLPSYRSVLSRPGGRVGGRRDDAAQFALLEVASEQMVLLWSGMGESRQRMTDVLTQAERAGFSFVGWYRATAEALALVLQDGIAETAPGYRAEKERLLDEIVADALRAGASDIHLEAQPKSARLRFRVHGDLEDGGVRIPRQVADELVRAVYTLADRDSKSLQWNPREYMDTQLTRHIRVGHEAIEVKLRFASLPVYPDGWDVTLRVLRMDQVAVVTSLEELGYHPIQARVLRRALLRSQGLIGFLGTTGSGKSTSMARLTHEWHALTGGRKKARTLENPPEYRIPFARQTPVTERDSDRGREAFSRGLRAILRNDPDLILAGEVRDADSAKIMQQAVQTGHKVMTTLHADSPITALERLVDLGVPRHIVADPAFVLVLVSQKLVALLCPGCKLPLAAARDRLTEDAWERYRAILRDDLENACVRGPGCSRCRQRGSIGRTLVAEVLVPDETLMRHVRAEDTLAARSYWRAQAALPTRTGDGMHGYSLLDHAIDKVRAGQVSPEDVELEIAALDDHSTTAAALAWYQRHVGPLVDVAERAHG
jgi:type II secretory ATPase GspE/PulE/Tfp pilus assembly ATPase PilB-like protein